MDYFKPKNTPHSHLLTRPRPTADTDWACYCSSTDEFEAFIHKSVLNQIHYEAKQAAPDETIGLLAGRVWRDEIGPYTLVMAAAGARPHEIEATPSHVRISGDGLAQVRERLEADNPALEIVGWYHSHPAFRAQFSVTDRVEQSTWNDPNHIGIVYSALQGEPPYGVYRGPEAAQLSPKRAAVLTTPFTTSPAGCAGGATTRLLGAVERETDAAEPISQRPSPPLAEPKPETQTYRAATKESSSGKDGWLLICILALGFGGTITSILWACHRMQAIEIQLAQYIQSHRQAEEANRAAAGSIPASQASPEKPIPVEQTPDAPQPSNSVSPAGTSNGTGDHKKPAKARASRSARKAQADKARKPASKNESPRGAGPAAIAPGDPRNKATVPPKKDQHP
jgi:proteasome lid subunit RPN8/RPN11